MTRFVCLLLVLLGTAPGVSFADELADAVAAHERGEHAAALKLLRPLAAEQGLARAQFNLASMYESGSAVPKDLDAAVGLYRRAAEQGHVQAQTNLGFMYMNGRGVEQDFAEAARWQRLAAEQGLWQAQYNLGILYGNGHGVPQDNNLAFLWCAIAADRVPASLTEMRDRVTRDRDLFAARLTPGQLAESQRLARLWKPDATGGN